MRVLVYTACYGGRDDPQPQCPQTIDCEWRYYTNEPPLRVPSPWSVWYVEAHHEHPNMAAKWIRTHPPFDEGFDYCIWIDGNMEVTNPEFVERALTTLDGAPVAAWEHPRRSSIRDEAEASLSHEAQGGRYDGLPLYEQVDAYIAEGYPDDRLYATGTIVWTRDAESIAHAWWDECVRWGFQDQLSFPVVLWRAGVDAPMFPEPQIRREDRPIGRAMSRRPVIGFNGAPRRRRGLILENDWLRIHKHRPRTGRP